MYTGKYINVICHFLLHIYWENKNKRLLIQNEGPVLGRKENNFQRLIVLTEILTGTHIWVLVLEDWKPSHQSEKNCACFTSLYPLLKRNKIASIPHKEVDWNAILFLWDTRYINHWSCILPPASFRIKWECTLIHKRDTWK